MVRVLRPAGQGLVAAGILLVILYFAGAYLSGLEAFRDAMDPFSVKTYLALLPLLPGALLLLLSDQLAMRRTRATGPAVGQNATHGRVQR